MTRGDRCAEKILELVVGPDVLDVGCAGSCVRPGNDTWLHGRLLEHFPDARGIDISQENIDAMKELGFSNVEVGDAQTFTTEDKYDTIVAGEVIEHLENPAGFLRSAAAALKPSGRIVLSTPYPFALMNIVYALLKFPRTCSNPEHTIWLCPTTIRALVNRSGLEIERLELIEDYEPGTDPMYQIFRHFVEGLGPLLSKRLRCNAILAVLCRTPAGSGMLQ